MNILKIKKIILDNKNKKLEFTFSCTRNKKEKFTGFITEIYPSIFIVYDELLNINKSFSYNDVLIKKLVIKN